jgi:hypothetical protein
MGWIYLGASTRHSTFYISMTNGSAILNTMHPYFNGFMFQMFVYTVHCTVVQLFECENFIIIGQCCEPHHFYAALDPAPSKNFDTAPDPAAPAPALTLLDV